MYETETNVKTGEMTPRNTIFEQTNLDFQEKMKQRQLKNLWNKWGSENELID